MNQVFEHGPQTPGDLNAGAAELTDFGDCQVDEVFPIRRAIGQPKPACRVTNPLVIQASAAHIPEEMMERRLAAAGSVVGHKMSMLQDLERGRSLEIDALVTVVQELGRLTGVATPAVDTLLALVQERGRALGLYTPLADIQHSSNSA